jgi:hypothetical protein
MQEREKKEFTIYDAGGGETSGIKIATIKSECALAGTN